jgi:hypothetical protein
VLTHIISVSKFIIIVINEVLQSNLYFCKNKQKYLNELHVNYVKKYNLFFYSYYLLFWGVQGTCEIASQEIAVESLKWGKLKRGTYEGNQS